MRTGWRKLLVRTPVILTLVLIVLMAVFYQWWTNPHAVRQLMIERLGERFVGANIRVDSAQLRVLGGISFNELRMSRRDGLDGGDFLYVPSGIIYHDKEKLLDGFVGIRKLELNRPRIRIVRERDGSFNIGDVLSPPAPEERLPTMVLNQATILIEDRGAAPGVPLIELRNMDITLVNDPLPIMTIVGTGSSDVLGPVRVRITGDRPNETLHWQAQLDAIPLGSELVQRLALFAPTTREHLQGLRGTGSLEAEIHQDARAPQPVTFDIRTKLDRGEFTHSRLPLPLERVTASCKISNRTQVESSWPRSPLGIYFPHFKLEGRLGTARVQVEGSGGALPGSLLEWKLQSACASLDARVDHLELEQKITTALPEPLHELEKEFQPRGPIHVTHTFRREADDFWNAQTVLTLAGGTARFHLMPYLVRDLQGTIERKVNQDNFPVITADYTLRAGGETVHVSGSLSGPPPMAIDLHLRGENLLCEPEMIAALPPTTRALAEQFQVAGRFGVEARVQREAGNEHFRNRYLFRFREGSCNYELFPYPLSQITGNLDIDTQGDSVRWELRQIRGRHRDADIQIEARNVPPGQRLDVWPSSKITAPSHPSTNLAPVRTAGAVQIRLQGTNLPIDSALEAALAPPTIPTRRTLQRAFQTMNPTGAIHFSAEVLDLPQLPNAIAVGLSLRGCQVRPTFFEVPLERVEATLYYSQGRVDVQNAQAFHPPGRILLPEGVVYCKPNGGFQVRLGRLQVFDMPASTAMIQALPLPLRKILETIRFRGVFNIATALVLETGEGSQPPQIWWDGGMGLRQGSVNFGIDITNITGQAACVGQHNGQAVEVALGNLLLDEAIILKQPLRQIQGTFEIPRDQPDRLQLRNFKANVFGGIVGGEGHLRFAPNFQYDLMMKMMQVDLEQIGKHNLAGAGAELEGQVTASLHLIGEGANLSDLRGNGRVDVPRGRMYRLPWVLEMIKVLSLRVPDQTAFDSARVTFAIEGPRLVVEELKLTGHPLSVRGNGAVNLDGSSLSIDIFLDSGKSLPPGVKELIRLGTDQLFKIKIRGKFDQVRYEKEFMPSMVAPLKQVIQGN